MISAAAAASSIMALDLSVKSTSAPFSGELCKEDPMQCDKPGGQDNNNNNNSSSGDSNNNNNAAGDNDNMCAINLSIPKAREEAESWPRHHQLPPNLSPHQIQLDIAALNLICLARLQETAAVLTGQQQRSSSPAAAASGSAFPLVNSNHNNRRNHKCDEPGCDKVSRKTLIYFIN